jgi:predicted RecA/RadA family phage recombinase
MRNFYSTGDTVQAAAPYAVASGGAALIGAALFGVAVGDIASGFTGNFKTTGIYALPKVNGQAMAAGAKLYWDNTAKNITTTAGGNVYVGVTIGNWASADTTVRIKLNGFAI